MSKGHPGVERISAILGVVSNSNRPLTYCEIAKLSKLSNSTCHMFLNGLVDVGYLTRLEDRSFVIGPGFEVVSLIAARIFPDYVGNFHGRDSAEFYQAIGGGSCPGAVCDGKSTSTAE